MDNMTSAAKVVECTDYNIHKNKSLDGYTLVVTIKDDVTKACEILKDELLREDVVTDFDKENSVRLTFSEIINNLGPAIEQLEGLSVTRSPQLCCILKLYPYICNRIRTFMGRRKMFDCEQSDRTVSITNLTASPEEATTFLDRNKEVSTGDMGQDSVKQPELYSEKLAKLYIQQGHYDKAIASYEKLIVNDINNF